MQSVHLTLISRREATNPGDNNRLIEELRNYGAYYSPWNHRTMYVVITGQDLNLA